MTHDSAQQCPSTRTEGAWQAWEGAAAAVLLCGIVLAALALRAQELSSSLWVDETITVRNASRDLPEILRNHLTPAIFIVSHFTLQIESAEAFLRLPYLLAGLAGIVAAYFAAAAAGGKTAGLAAALFLAVSAFHVGVSHEARYYAPLILLYFLGFWQLHRCLTRGTALDWTIHGLILAAGLLTHLSMIYFFVWANAAAFVWLALARGTLRQRALRLLALGLCTAAALSPIALRYAVMGSAIAAQAPAANEAEAAGDDPDSEAAAPAPGSTFYTLSPAEYRQYLGIFFPARSPWAAGLLVFLGAAGLIRVWLRDRAMALPLTAVFFLLPLPLFYIPFNHWYSPRYLAAALAAGTLLLAFGATGTAAMAGQALQALAKRTGLPRRFPGGAKGLGRLGAGIAFCGIAAMLAPSAAHALRAHYASHPSTDWKGAAAFVRDTLDARDVMIFMPWPTGRPVSGTYWKHVLATPFAHYLERSLPHPGSVVHTVRQVGAANWAEARAHIERFPDRTVWLVIGDEERYPEADQRALEAFAPAHGRFNRITVRARGAATANLLPRGGFGEDAEDLLGPGFRFEEAAPGLGGARVLRIDAPEPEFRTLLLPVETADYPIRNANFSFWTGGAPAGWETVEGAVQRTGEARDGRHALALGGDGAPATLRHALRMPPAPGSALRLHAWVSAPPGTAGNIALRYLVEGEPRQAMQAFAGGEGWTPITLDAALPRDADREGVAIELSAAAGPFPIGFDALRLERAPEASTLDPNLDYLLSMRLKSADVAPGIYPSRVVKVTLGGDIPGEEQGLFRQLLLLEGTRDWEHYRFRLLPGRNLPLTVRNLRVGIGFAGGSGTLWIDGVQLEAQAAPTPFAPGVRMPHDEFIAEMAL